MSTDTSKNTALNDQIADSISALQNLTTSNSDEGIALMTYQIMAQATALAMLNAVNQQQQMYILHNAVTAATAKAALDSKPEEAVEIINKAMNNTNILETFNGLKNFMDELTKTCNVLKEKMANKEETPEGNSR
jgi:hypothetical protein